MAWIATGLAARKGQVQQDWLVNEIWQPLKPKREKRRDWRSRYDYSRKPEDRYPRGTSISPRG